jgi:hypothetical protein
MQFDSPDINLLFHWNNQPLDDFEGLSPNQMHGLLHKPFSESDSPLRINHNLCVDVLNRIPFYRDIFRFLTALQEEQPLKLTPKGNLPRKFCRDLYDMGVKDEDLLMLKNHPINVEMDSPYILVINHFTKMMGLTKTRYNRLSLTIKGAGKLKRPEDNDFFLEILSAYTQNLNWGFIDGYPRSWILQAGFGFSILLVQKHGQEERDIEFYSGKYLKAFPKATADFPNRTYFTPEQSFRNAYKLRVFERFLRRFAFIEITENDIRNQSFKIKKIDLVDKIISWQHLGLSGLISNTS